MVSPEQEKAMIRHQREAGAEHSRYGEAYARTLARLSARHLIPESQAPLKDGELYDVGTPQYVERLQEIVLRLSAFLTKAEESPAYDFDSVGAEVERRALDDVVILYALGGVSLRGVEALARGYVKACKRPERVERGTRINPAPPPGTYPARTQAGLQKQLAQPPKVARKSLDIPPEMVEGREAELTATSWHYARLCADFQASSMHYFAQKELRAGMLGYAQLCPESLRQFPEKAHLWHIKFYPPEVGLSYWLNYAETELEVYSIADNQKDIAAAWTRGFVSKK